MATIYRLEVFAYYTLKNFEFYRKMVKFVLSIIGQLF